MLWCLKIVGCRGSNPVSFSFLSLLLIISTFCCKVTIAQNGTIQGRVKDQETVLQSATVSIAGKIFLSNSKGQFSVTLKPGVYILNITHVGYKTFEQSILLNEGEVRSLEINLIRADQLDEVRVLGSRSFIQRSNLNTPVPVDVLTTSALKNTGQPSLIQMLNYTAPSLNTSRQHLSDPITLRGLSPDHLLILVNGIRYHNMAGINSGSIRGTLGRGAVSNDLNSIPFSSIDKIEILRDGASAQYGSDAIAGVMNIVLKKTLEKTSIDLHLGQHFKGDGENILFGLHHGIPLAKKRVSEFLW